MAAIRKKEDKNANNQHIKGYQTDQKLERISYRFQIVGIAF